MESAESVVFSGSQTIPEADSDLQGRVLVIRASGSGEQNAETFSEPFELSLSSAEGDMLNCSKSKLPGITIYQNEDDTIERTTFIDEHFSVKDLGNDLPQDV